MRAIRRRLVAALAAAAGVLSFAAAASAQEITFSGPLAGDHWHADAPSQALVWSGALTLGLSYVAPIGLWIAQESEHTAPRHSALVLVPLVGPLLLNQAVRLPVGQQVLEIGAASAQTLGLALACIAYGFPETPSYAAQIPARGPRTELALGGPEGSYGLSLTLRD